MPARVSGRIVKLLPDKGFGFIQGDDGKEYFFHRSSVQDWFTLAMSQRVTFHISKANPKGPRAEDVEPELLDG